MNTNEIITKAAGYIELADGEALYYAPQSDSVIVGRDGCQPSNSLCLRVGPDHTSNLDWAAITASVSAFTADRNTANAKAEPTATENLMGLLMNRDGTASPRGMAYLMGHVSVEALIAEVDTAMVKARAKLAADDATPECRERGAGLIAEGVRIKGLMVAVADLDPLRRSAERAECLSKCEPITPELRARALVVGVKYTRIVDLMTALTFTPQAVNFGIDYARGRRTLSDVAGLLVGMVDILEREGAAMPERGRKQAQSEVEALRAALLKVEAQTEAERENERILWCQAIDSLKTGLTAIIKP